MALEAINHAGHLPKTNLLVVLNDNEMSISPNVGAISRHLNKMRLSPPSAVHLRQPQGTGQADPLGDSLSPELGRLKGDETLSGTKSRSSEELDLPIWDLWMVIILKS